MDFFVNTCSITGLIAGLIYLLAGYYVYRSNRIGIVSRLFFLTMILTALWTVGISFVSISNMPVIVSTILLRFLYANVIILPIVFFHMTYRFLGYSRRNFIIPFGYGIATTLCFLNFSTDFFVADVEKNSFFYYKPGILYILFIAYSILYDIYSFFLLISTGKMAEGYNRSQIKYYTIGSVIVCLQIMTSFPFISKLPILNYCAFMAVPFLAIFFYSVIKYKLFNINLSVDRDKVHRILFTLFIAGFVFFVFILSEVVFSGRKFVNQKTFLIAGVLFFVVLAIVKPLDYILSAFIDKFLFHKKYEYQKTLRDAARGMAKITDIDKLFGLIVHFITSRIRIKSVDLFYLNKGDNKYVARLSRGNSRLNESKNVFISKNSSIVLWLEEKKDTLIYDEVIRWLKNEKLFPHRTVLRKTIEDIKQKFEDLEAVLCVPCFSKNNLLGFLMLGEKISSGMYTQEDLDVLSTLSHEAAIAIENAQLYREIYEKMKHIQMLYEKERKLFISTAIAFAAAIDAKDKYTHGHAERVTYYCMSIYEDMQLAGHVKFQPDFSETLQIAALLHDVGKIGTPDNILNKKGSLNKDEFDEIKKHPIIGASILSPIQELGEVTDAIRHHQERYDGSGYPEGLQGDQIPLAARIIMVADAFDAMVSDRPYRSRVMAEVAVHEIKKGIGTQFDPHVVEGFLAAYEKGKIVSLKPEEHKTTYIDPNGVPKDKNKLMGSNDSKDTGTSGGDEENPLQNFS